VIAWRSARTAAHDALVSPGLWPVALAGFLARGGLILFVAPVVIPPSLVGLATFIGPASITPTGPTIGLVVRIGLGIGLLGAALLAGILVGAIAEIALISASAAGRGSARQLLRRVVVIRLVSLVPVAAVFAIGIQRLGQIVYLELTLPTDLVTPIVIRVAAQAPEIVAAILVAWIFGETWGGLATRLAVLRGDGAGRALAGGLVLFVRRIVAVLPLLFVSVLVAGLILGLVIEAIAWSWGFVRDALLGGSGTAALPAMAGSALLFVACWVAGLAIAGALATWRAVAWTLIVGEDHRGSGRTAPDRATL
jgi:hypothetical protein